MIFKREYDILMILSNLFNYHDVSTELKFYIFKIWNKINLTKVCNKRENIRTKRMRAEYNLLATIT